MTPAPALAVDPCSVYTGPASRNSGLASVSGCSSVSAWTATTPGSARTLLTLLAGMIADTPPNTVS